jgi:RHS repeat-associated protein
MTTARTGSTPTPFGFVGQGQYQTDADTGLMLLGHRYYDASTGRFLSADPAQAGTNWYDYCDNDPLSKVDPSGYDPGPSFGNYNPGGTNGQHSTLGTTASSDLGSGTSASVSIGGGMGSNFTGTFHGSGLTLSSTIIPSQTDQPPSAPSVPPLGAGPGSFKSIGTFPIGTIGSTILQATVGAGGKLDGSSTSRIIGGGVSIHRVTFSLQDTQTNTTGKPPSSSGSATGGYNFGNGGSLQIGVSGQSWKTASGTGMFRYNEFC